MDIYKVQELVEKINYTFSGQNVIKYEFRTFFHPELPEEEQFLYQWVQIMGGKEAISGESNDLAIIGTGLNIFYEGLLVGIVVSNAKQHEVVNHEIAKIEEVISMIDSLSALINNSPEADSGDRDGDTNPYFWN